MRLDVAITPFASNDLEISSERSSYVNLEAVLGSEVKRALLRGIAMGRYHALLGAGASVGGTDGDGTALPGGVQLAEELRDQFSVPSGPASLMRVHEAAKSRQTANGQSLAEYVTMRFTRTTPPTWMVDLTVIQWAALWTLNIDDCVERCYSANADRRRQSLVSISWTESHRTARAAGSEVLLVHLHGKASRAARADELVFDMSGYLNAAASQHRWHRIFGDDYPTAPFLIVGASLENEFDLHAVLSQGHLKSAIEHPSLIILPTIDDLAAEEYRRFGLIPVEATAEEFFKAVVGELPQSLAELTGGEALALEETAPEAIRFLQQWLPLDPSRSGRRDRRHDFYAGHEPEWNDIVDDLPSTRDVIHRMVRAISEQAAGTSVAHVLSGDPFSGKTTVMLALARALSSVSFAPVLFQGESAPDLSAVTWWLRRHPRTVLLIDDAEDFAKDIAALLRSTADDPVTVRVVLAERRNRVRHIDSQFATLNSTKTELHGRLTTREVGALIAKLDEKHRLGELTTCSREERITYFDSRGRELFSTMAELERGRGFVARVKDEYAALATREAKVLLQAVGLMSKLGYSVPSKIVKSACGLRPVDLEALVGSGELADFVYLRSSSVAPRHRYFGALIFDECMSDEERFSMSRELALALAPHVSPAAIASSTVEYRMARALMGARFVRQLAGSSEGALRWYEAVEAAYDWNARFWEQRALAAADLALWEPAYSWAKQAVARRKDSYTMNTVGVILMRRALHEASERNWPADSFEAAEEALVSARDLEGAQAEYPFETFFTYCLRLIEKVSDREPALNEQLRNLWMNWQLAALGLDPTTRERLADTLIRANQQWDRLFEGSQA